MLQLVKLKKKFKAVTIVFVIITLTPIYAIGSHFSLPPPRELANPRVFIDQKELIDIREDGSLIYAFLPKDVNPSSVHAIKTQLVEHGRLFRSEFVGSLEKPVTVVLNEKEHKVLSIEFVKKGEWRLLNAKAPWLPRDGGGLRYFKGALWLLGGWEGNPVTNEIWKSTNGRDWTFVENAPWEARHGAGWVVHDEKIYVISGDLHDDVWSSSDGIHWQEENAHAPFGKRYTPNVVSVGKYIYLFGGQYWTPVDWCHDRPDCRAVGLNDVWRSTDGRNWQLVTAHAPWAPRALVHGFATAGRKFYMVGGGLKVAPPNKRYQETLIEYRDMWWSKDGKNWHKEMTPVPWPGRTHFTIASLDGDIYVAGGSIGTQLNLANDFYRFHDHKWTKIDAPWLPRHAASMTAFNGSIIFTGGMHNDLWQYFPDDSDGTSAIEKIGGHLRRSAIGRSRKSG